MSKDGSGDMLPAMTNTNFYGIKQHGKSKLRNATFYKESTAGSKMNVTDPV